MRRQMFNTVVAQYGTKTVASTGDKVEWSGGAHCYLPSVKFYGANAQDGTPTPDNPLPIASLKGFYQTDSGAIFVIPNLNGFSGYNDEWDYVSGKGLRRIHKVVLDGVSDYGKVVARYVDTPGVAYCAFLRQFKSVKTGGGGFKSTHFKGSWNQHAVGNVWTTTLTNTYFTVDADKYPTIASVNEWLAEQYANGNPVTIYYAIADPIPFAERPDPYQPIPNDGGRISFGDGTMSGVPFEVSYITHS